MSTDINPGSTDSESGSLEVHAPPPTLVRTGVAVVRFLVPIIILGLGAFGSSILLSSAPSADRAKIEERPALVETILASSESKIAEIIAYGIVEPNRELVLQPQVGGRVVRLNESLRAGGRVSTGEMLFSIDPRDYELAIDQRRAEVANAEVALQLEQARGAVAEKEWELLGESIESSDVGRSLARREPQRVEKEAALAAARGRLEMAELDLQRTVISAPFNGIVMSDDIEIGQVVSPQTRAATIAGSDRFDVMVAVPLEKLAWIRADPADSANNSTAIVTQELGDGRRISRPGRVDRIVGEVERAGRLAKVRVLVDDPLARSLPTGDASAEEIPLLLGSYVHVEIAGPLLEDVIELPRAVIRAKNTVWVMTVDDRLDIRPIEILVNRPETVVIRSLLAPGEAIVSSPLVVALQDMALERIDPTGTPGESPEVDLLSTSGEGS